MAKPVISYYKIGIGYFAWWLIWAVLQIYLLHRFGVPYNDATTDASITQLILATAGYLFHSSMRFYQPSRRNVLYGTGAGLLLTVAGTWAQQTLIIESISDPLYHSFISDTIILRGMFTWLQLMLIGVLTWFGVYISEREDIEQRNADTARLARNAELSNLRMQLQPHFLFNSLNSISALIGSQPAKAREMIQQLSDFLRGTIKREERPRVSLQEELMHLQLYLEIEKVRFGHRLTTVISAEGCMTAELPPLLLQPLVENAIKFGLYDTIGEITISISARLEKNMLFIEVKNPFDPETAQPPRGTGFGLDSVRRRLYLLYAQNDLLTTLQDNNIFTTSVKIPQPI